MYIRAGPTKHNPVSASRLLNNRLVETTKPPLKINSGFNETIGANKMKHPYSNII